MTKKRSEKHSEQPAEGRPEDGPNAEAASEQWQRDALQRELEAARSQLADLEGLLGDLPSIFERRFQERLQPMLEQQRLMAEENQALLDQVRHALGSGDPAGGRPALPAGRPESGEPPATPPVVSPAVVSTAEVPSAPTSAPAASPKPPPASAPPSPADPAPQTGLDGPHSPVTEQAITVRHWVLPRWAPEGLSIGRLRRLAGLTGLSAGVAVVVAGAVVFWHRQPAPTPVAMDGAAVRSKGPESVVVFASSGVSWLAVRDADGTTLFEGEMQGERRFPLGRGLRAKAGRPDLVTVRVDQEPARGLGRVDQVEWREIKAP